MLSKKGNKNIASFLVIIIERNIVGPGFFLNKKVP